MTVVILTYMLAAPIFCGGRRRRNAAKSFFLPTMGRAAALVVLAWLRCACAQIPEEYVFDDDDFFRPTQKPVQVNTYQQGAEHCVRIVAPSSL